MAHVIKNVDQLQCILNHQHTRILFPIKNSNHKSTVLTSMFRDCVFQHKSMETILIIFLYKNLY